MKAADWIVRTLLLVLSGMATLAVIGSIAAIPAGGLPQMLERTVADAGDPGGAAGQGRATGQVTAPSIGPAESAGPPPTQANPWMESLTYAVIALAGIAAAALLVLMRIAGYLGEIARRDRL